MVIERKNSARNGVGKNIPAAIGGKRQPFIDITAEYRLADAMIVFMEGFGEPAAIKAALVRQVVSSVLWEDCMRGVAAAGATQFWELGPGGVLAGLARRTEKAWFVKSFSEFADVSAA